MAAALDRPVVGIYGSSSPKYTPPLQDDDKRALIYENLSCSPCFKRECPLEHMNCLNNISVEHVKDSILRLVNNFLHINSATSSKLTLICSLSSDVSPNDNFFSDSFIVSHLSKVKMFWNDKKPLFFYSKLQQHEGDQ